MADDPVAAAKETLNDIVRQLVAVVRAHGHMLRLYRAHDNLTVRDLAAKTGISAATLSRIERGHEMNADTLLKLIHWMRQRDDAPR